MGGFSKCYQALESVIARLETIVAKFDIKVCFVTLVPAGFWAMRLLIPQDSA